MTIARPIALSDRPDAGKLTVTRGHIHFEDIHFGYGRKSGLIGGLTLDVRPGEKIGLVSRSGAGKSTLVNLLLRFFDLRGGRILIDGQDIATVSQDESAYTDLNGHAGYIAVASFDSRQHSLRASQWERG